MKQGIVRKIVIQYMPIDGMTEREKRVIIALVIGCAVALAILIWIIVCRCGD